MERDRIKERCDAGRAAARPALALNGKTHRGKYGLGRPPVADPEQVATWRLANLASAAEAAAHFGISTSTVKRYCRIHKVRSVLGLGGA